MLDGIGPVSRGIQSPLTPPPPPLGASPFCSWSLADGQDKTWPRLFPLAVAAALLYPVGIFAMFLLILLRVRKSLDTRAAKALAGNLYMRYKPGAYFWEVVITARKVCTSCCVLVPCACRLCPPSPGGYAAPTLSDSLLSVVSPQHTSVFELCPLAC